jgi:1,4-dihydroxy-2-naphthoate octaprenyltransferase
MFAVVEKVKPWIVAARPVGHGMLALPMLWGQAAAWTVTGHFSWAWFALAQLLAVLIQVHTLYLNDYADEPLDRDNHDYWLSGGSRVIPDGQLTGQQLYRASFIPAALILLLSIAALAYDRAWLPLFAVLALLASASYSLPPAKTAYRGLGELHQGLSCGLALPLCAYYLQVGSLSGFPWLWLSPIVLVFFASNIMTALPDMESDARGGKRSYPVRFGLVSSMQHAAFISLLAAVIAACFAPLAVALPPALLFLYLGLAPRQISVPNIKRFMLLTIAGHLWLMVSWVADLFGTI